MRLITLDETLERVRISRATFFRNRDVYASAIVKLSPRCIRIREDRLDAILNRKTEARYA